MVRLRLRSLLTSAQLATPRVRILEYFFSAAPIAVLFLLVLYTFARFFLLPYAGFQYSFDGTIEDVFVDSQSDGLLRIGDQITSIDTLSWEAYRANRTLVLFQDLAPQSSVHIQVLREGVNHSVLWTITGPTTEEILARLGNVWWLGFLIWLAGLLTYLFVRPKGSTWRLLTSFYFLLAMVFATRMDSNANILGSRIVSDSLLWLFCAVCWDLHWSFPKALTTRTGYTHVILLYVPALIMAGLEVTPLSVWLDEVLALYVTLGGSALIFSLRLVSSRQRDPSIVKPLFLVVLAFLPTLLTGFWLVRDSTAPLALIGVVYLTWPLIPGAYFYLACRTQLQHFEEQVKRLFRFYLVLLTVGVTLILLSLVIPGQFAGTVFDVVSPILIGIVSVIGLGPFFLLPAIFRGIGEINLPYLARMEVRANRLVTPYLYVTVLGTIVAIATTILTHWLTTPTTAHISVFLLVMTIAITAVAGYGRFGQWVDTKILGITLSPPTLIERYVDQISVILEQEQLISLLTRHVVPSLFVRQSTLLAINDTGTVETLYQDNLGPDQLAIPSAIQTLLEKGTTTQPIRFSDPAGWVRIALPLRANDRLIGIWLLGRRDPDDDYGESDIAVLRTLAGQTAIALVNVAQARNLHALFQVHIDQQEIERGRLARELHDDVLNRLAVLATTEPQSVAQQQATYQQLSMRLRQVVAGLRPAMLNYGLSTALEELTDELARRAGTSPTITLDVPLSLERHEPRIEEHLFRIVEQAANNALRHAQASAITIGGSITADNIHLEVRDDGVGFPPDQALNLPGLLLKGHFGLVGMFERASLVGATLEITSHPLAGTVVTLDWQPRPT